MADKIPNSLIRERDKVKDNKSHKDENELCEVFFVDEARVRSVRRGMKSDSVVNDLSEIFKVLGDPTRTKILFALSQEELCVCDIANLLGVSASAVSHQLRLLRNLRLVKFHREGKMAYYSLDDDHIKNLFAEGLKHVQEKGK